MLLAEYFLDQISERWQLPKAQLSQRSINALTDYSFPGNVRELENILERACTLADGEFIEPEDLQLPQLKPVIKSRRFDAVVHQPEQVSTYSQPQNEREEILHALDQTRWNRTAAAKVLGMTFRQLRYRIKKYKLDQAP